MKVWIDNTGLHSAGRCLAGKATLDQHLRGFLQLATLLIFSDSITYGDYEIEEVAETGQRYRQRLISLGVDPPTLTSRHVGQSAYGRACKATARLAAEEWPSHFDRCVSEAIVASFDVPTGVKARENWIPAFVHGPNVDNPEALLSSRRATGAVEYMLSDSPLLRAAVAGTIDTAPNWGAAESYRLLSFLRSILNDQLAKQGKATYVPAVSRAEQLNRESTIISAHVEQHLKEMAGRWKPAAPSIPRVSLALLRRAKGDPAGVVSEALEMREKARWPRKHLRQRLAELNRDPLAADDEFRDEDFERYARSVLGLENEPRLIDALEMQFIVGLPAISLSAGKLYDWVQHSLWKRRLVILTDLSRAPEFGELDETYLRTFVEKSTGRSFADSGVLESTRGT